MTKNKQLTEYLKEVLNLANDVELSVYDEDNNTDDLSNGIVNVRVENLELDEFLIRQISYISND
jgi:hypothetical protein